MSERARCAGSRWAPPAARHEHRAVPARAVPASPTTSVRTITEMMAKGTYGIIVLATKDLDGTFERLQAGDAEVVQEPTEQPTGIRDCAFRDPAGSMVRINELR